MDIRAAEISAILKEQIANSGQEAEVSEGARCSRSATASPASTARQRAGRRDGRVRERRRGMALNLESDNVGIVITGNDCEIKEGRPSSARAIVDVPVGSACSAAWSMRAGNLIDGKGPITAASDAASTSRRRALFRAGRKMSRWRPVSRHRCADPDRRASAS